MIFKNIGVVTSIVQIGDSNNSQTSITIKLDNYDENGKRNIIFTEDNPQKLTTTNTIFMADDFEYPIYNAKI